MFERLISEGITPPSCDNCTLNNKRVVLGSQTRNPEVLVIGEAPGNEEVLRLEPFAGASGQLLKRCLSLAGVTSYSMTNICLCQPEKGRDLSTREIQACRERLLSEIMWTNPKRILCLGSVASEAITGKKVSAALNRYQTFNGIPTICTYHPAAVLRMPEMFRDMADGFEKLVKEPGWRLKKHGVTLEYLYDGYPFFPYEVLETAARVHEVLDSWTDAWVVDIETSVVNYWNGHLACIGIMPRNQSHKAYIIPADVCFNSDVFERLQVFLSSANTRIAHQSQFEYMWMKDTFKVTPNFDEDTLLMHYALDERAGSDSEVGGASAVAVHSLKYLGGLYYDLPDWSDLMKPYKKDFSSAPREILYRYLALDLLVEDMLYADLSEQIIDSLAAGERICEAYDKIMCPAISTLADMSMEGIKLDIPYLVDLSAEWDIKIKDSIQEIQSSVGRPLNINSPKQLKELLFEEWNLPKIKQTAKGGDSADKEVLDELIKLCHKKGMVSIEDILGLIKETRQLKHIKATYIDGLQVLATDQERVHTHFLIHGTPTGRLAARNPNLQNQPARIGGIIRDAFISDEGRSFVDADYKQLEFRCLAYLSRDTELVRYITEGRDIHSEVAGQFFGIEPGTETDQQRITTKAFVFGVIYQRTAQSIAEEYDIPMAEANRRHAMLFNMFPGIRSWMDKQVTSALELGYVESVFGRRRRFPLVTSRNREDIKRYAINSPIQSMASDINLIAAINTRKTLKHENAKDPDMTSRWTTLLHDNFRSHLLVHDSHLASVDDRDIEAAIHFMRTHMESPDILPDSPVPFKVDIKVGKRWGSLEKIK